MAVDSASFCRCRKPMQNANCADENPSGLGTTPRDLCSDGERLRSNTLPWGKETTIVALTGWGQEHDRQRSKAAGCDGHLVKPVSRGDLDALLQQLETADH